MLSGPKSDVSGAVLTFKCAEGGNFKEYGCLQVLCDKNWRIKRLNEDSAHLYQHQNVGHCKGFSHRLKTIQLLQLLLFVHRCYFVFNHFCQDSLEGQNSLYATRAYSYLNHTF